MSANTWGRWTFNPDNACLETAAPWYQIPVYELTTSAEILDWIFQVQEKTWSSSEDIGDLVAAIVDLVGRHVASAGIDHPIDPKPGLTARFGCTF